MLATIERSGHAASELRVEGSGLARNADLQMRAGVFVSSPIRGCSSGTLLLQLSEIGNLSRNRSRKQKTRKRGRRESDAAREEQKGTCRMVAPAEEDALSMYLGYSPCLPLRSIALEMRAPTLGN
jgi:hypothetical protein